MRLMTDTSMSGRRGYVCSPMRLPNKSSRIAPGVRPWLSHRLEQLWGIDGKVYSHYILSVLLDGVDNEFLTSAASPPASNQSEEESNASKRRSRTRPKSRHTTSCESDGCTSEEADADEDSFETRLRAVVRYLNSLTNNDNEVNSLVAELVFRLGYSVDDSSKTTKLLEDNKNYIKFKCLDEKARKSLTDLVNEEGHCSLLSMGRGKTKKSGETGPGHFDACSHGRRARFASLDECQSIFVPKLLLKHGGGKNATRQHRHGQMTNRNRLSSEDSARSHMSADNMRRNMRGQGSKSTKSVGGIECSSECEDNGDDIYDFSISFLDSYDELDETYNEAFPALIETASAHHHFFTVASCQSTISVGKHADRPLIDTTQSDPIPTASRVALPPNPVSKGQPVWSGKVKAPIGRPLNNNKFSDADLSNSILEEANVIFAVDEAMKRTAHLVDKCQLKSDCPASTALYNSYHSLLFDHEFDLSLLNMIGLTPEKLNTSSVRDVASGKDPATGSEDIESLINVSKCTKDLFKGQSNCAETPEANNLDGLVDLEKDLLSPDLSKIWDRDYEDKSLDNQEKFNSLTRKSSQDCLCDEERDCTHRRKLSSGTINTDSVWMPTEADLGSSLTSSVAPLTSPLMKSDSTDSSSNLIGSLGILLPPAHEACFDLLAGFPGLLRSPEAADNSESLQVTESEKCWCGKTLKSTASMCTCSEPDLLSDVYFSTYNPRLFDLLDFYMLRENIGFGNGGGSRDVFALGNFYRKRDIYFDEYFAETMAPPTEHRPPSGLHSTSDYSFPPVLTEHFLMEIMKFNEQISPSTPVGSEFDTGSLFDDRASENTALQQRANSLILKHQKLYQQSVTHLNTCDAAMQTDAADQSDEEHRFSPIDAFKLLSESESGETEMLLKKLEDDPANETHGCRGSVPANAQVLGDSESNINAWSFESAVNAELNDVNTTTEYFSGNEQAIVMSEEERVPKCNDHDHFQCPAGCDPNAESSVHQYSEESLLISPKTHFRPISVESVDDEEDTTFVFEEKLTIEQSFDGIPVPNFLQITSECKDSRFFSSWCQRANDEDNPAIESSLEVSGNGTGDNAAEEVLRSIWTKETSGYEDQEATEDSSWWYGSLDKNASISDWVTSSSNHFEHCNSHDYDATTPGTEQSFDSSSTFNAAPVGCFEVNPVEELEFVFDHELNEQRARSIFNPPATYQTEFPVGFIPMETLSDVNCKCMADLPGELGIDPLCQLHGAGAAIYLTATAAGDAHSLSSGGDWSMGSSSSLRALPPTTAINPNMIVGYQGPFGGFATNSNNGKSNKSKHASAANLLQLNQSIVSQRQKRRSKSSKSDKDNKCAGKPCSYFLDGGCHRLDCKFSHDLASIPCRFFAEGGCFKSIFCPFSHAVTTPQAQDHTINPTVDVGEPGAGLAYGSLDSISPEVCSARENSESDTGVQTLEVGSVNLISTASKSAKRKRSKAKSAAKKNAPNVKDKLEFPILPIETTENTSIVETPLTLGSIYPTEGFSTFNDVAVM